MKFYALRSPEPDEDSAVTDFLDAEDSKTGDAPRCPRCSLYTSGLPVMPPVRVELEMWGNRFGDIAFGPSDEFLLSSRVLDLCHASHLTGLVEVGLADVTKVKKHRKLVERAPPYFCCRASLSRTAIDDAKSGLVREPPPPCEECRLGGIIHRTARIVIEPGSWSGEDIFVARGLPGTVLVSERFKALCERHEVSNVKLVPAEAYAFDYYPGEK